MDNSVVVDEVLASRDSTTLLQVNCDVPETRHSQPPPPGTDDIEEFLPERIPKQDAEENPKVDNNRNEITGVAKCQSTDILMESDDVNVSMDLVASPSNDKSEPVDESQRSIEVSKVDSICSSQLDVTNSSKAVEKTIVTPRENPEMAEQSSKKIESIDSSKSDSSNALETVPKSLPQTCIESEKISSSRTLSKRRSRKERSISHSPRRKFPRPPSISHSPRRKCSRSRSISRSPRRRLSPSRSPVRFPALSKSERRNYRRYSPSSSSSPSLRRYRTRSPSRRQRHSYSSYSSSSASSPQRRRRSSSRPVKSRSSDKRYSRDCYEYCEAVKEVKYGSRSKIHRIRERSSSQSPKNLRPSRRRSYSTSPKQRLRRLMAHETLSKNAGCVVRFDASKSFSTRQDCDNIEGGRRKIAHVTSEVRVEVKSTVNSEKSTEDGKMSLFQQKIRVIKKRLRHERREFRKRPESYPTFAEEWKMFWSNRFKQIQADGKEDPHNYDYRPDWTQYWLIRVKQIYKEKYKKLKTELKEDLGISSERKNENVTNSEIVEISDGQESASPCEEAKRESVEPEIDSQKNTVKDVESNKSKQQSKEENSAINSLSSVSMQQLNLLTQTISACVSSACSQNYTPSVESALNLSDLQPASLSLMRDDDSVDIDLKDDISIISVLRQLSVLETQLGTSATPITNLLANGLSREKKEAGSSIQLLTRENRLFLDVIKEKLKGQLILEVVPDAMIKATKKCIKSIDELMAFIPEPKLLDPRLSKIPQEKSSSASAPASLATTVHTPFDARNNFSTGTYSMPPVFPTASVHSVPAPKPSVHVNAASQLPPSVQAQQQYPVRSEPYFTSAPHGTSPGTGYPTNSVHLTNQGRPTAASAASVPLTTPRQCISNRTVGTPNSGAHSDQTTSVPRTAVQSASAGASSATTYALENQSELTKRPSIYDKIPWSEQLLAASNLAARPSPHPSVGSSSFRSSAASSVSDPRLTLGTSSYRPQIPHVSSSTRQPTSSMPSTSHSRTIPASSTTRNFEAVPSASSYSNNQVTPANVPSNGSGLHYTVSTFNTANTIPMTAVSGNSVVSTENSMFTNIKATIPSSGSQIATASSSTTGVSSSTTTSHAIGPIIDLTDDSPDYDESDEPINKLSEVRIIHLLKNFRQIPRARQQELVDFLRELEKTNLAVVENYKKYVQLPFNK